MIAFLENALGFIVQFLPCVILIFLPFPEEAFGGGSRFALGGIMP